MASHKAKNSDKCVFKKRTFSCWFDKSNDITLQNELSFLKIGVGLNNNKSAGSPMNKQRRLVLVAILSATGSIFASSDTPKITAGDARRQVEAYQKEHPKEFDLTEKKKISLATISCAERTLAFKGHEDQIADKLASILLDIDAIDVLCKKTEIINNKEMYAALSDLWKQSYQKHNLIASYGILSERYLPKS